jgi:amidohydrolase
MKQFFQSLTPTLKQWRHEFHKYPEIGFDEVKTSKAIYDILGALELNQIQRNIAKTGVVAKIEGTKPTNATLRSVGLRADIDALPMQEEGISSHQSTILNRFHGCGHDGHTTMLLGAATYLAQNRNQFSGIINCIFQPAEEGRGGAREMIKQGLFRQFPCNQVFAMHNWPGIETGRIDVQPGPRMASSDSFEIAIEGIGGHAALPHQCSDTILAGSQIIIALQTVVSRRINPIDPVVISITTFHAGTGTYNVLPQNALLKGTIRAFSPLVRKEIISMVESIIKDTSKTFGVQSKMIWKEGSYAPTVNTLATVGSTKVTHTLEPSMGAEDFSDMLAEIPGAYVFIGAGEKSYGLHHPKYDFNDELLPLGAELFVNLALESLKN